MNKQICRIEFILVLSVLPWLALPPDLFAQDREVTVNIHLRGVYESRISLLALSGSGTFKTIAEAPGVKNNETTRLSVNRESLPGEFVVRFDYKEKETSTPYPSEKHIFINDQDLELWVSPMYCNNADSTRFQEDEKENVAFVRFTKESGRQKDQLGLLQNFLMNYDDTGSKFYKQGVKEYEQRRKAYNQWLVARSHQDNALFVSALFCFQYVPEISWKGSETDRIRSLINHYFDGMDFKNPLLIKTSGLNKWMDVYVNLYGQLSTTALIRDSLFPLAGKVAIEKARLGHPRVYGWMVDYFYRGYETNGLPAGMKILEPYLNDPNCLTSKREEIARRLKGIKTLIPGSKAPDISLRDPEGNLFELNHFETPHRYILIFFWSAGCSHCIEMVNALYPWQQKAEVQQKIMVLAISLDETVEEMKAWQLKRKQLSGWKQLQSGEGIRSKVASDYYVLATPVMVLLDAKTREIVALPNTLDELINAVE